eukprot:4562682-Karenia_brevis.AAC.1
MKMTTSSLGPVVLKMITCGAPPRRVPEFVRGGTAPGCGCQSILCHPEKCSYRREHCGKRPQTHT